MNRPSRRQAPHHPFRRSPSENAERIRAFLNGTGEPLSRSFLTDVAVQLEALSPTWVREWTARNHQPQETGL